MKCPHCGNEVNLTTDLTRKIPADLTQKMTERESDLFSLSVLDPDSSPLISKSSEVLRKTRGPAFEYPSEFEVGWSATDRTGSKYDAFLAWQKAGRPSGRVIAIAWAKWRRLQSWQDGFVPHVRKWIRGRCFSQEPQEPVKKTNARPSANGSVPAPPQRQDPYCQAHSSFHKNLPAKVRSFSPKPSCPACQEYNAIHANRSGEPESMGDLLARMGK